METEEIVSLPTLLPNLSRSAPMSLLVFLLFFEDQHTLEQNHPFEGQHSKHYQKLHLQKLDRLHRVRTCFCRGIE